MQTEIINYSVPSDLDNAAKIIKHGGLVVFPTETVYGLGADATNEAAVKKIYRAKGRPSDNPLIIHIANISDADKYVYTNKLFYLLAETFMPGPFTVVLPAKEIIPMCTRGGLKTVALRCPENNIARLLIKKSGVPIAAPSANLSGSPSPTRFEHVFDDMNGRVDVLIDGGECDIGLESTIVKIDDDSVTLLRPGKITIEQMEQLGVKVNVSSSVKKLVSKGEAVLSPGMKYKHYAPKAPLILVDSDIKKLVTYISEAEFDKNIAIIAYSEEIDFVKESLPYIHVYDFGKKHDTETQAHMLFKLLRDTDEKEYSVIFAPLPSENGLGLALYNRMIRAAAHKIIRM